MRRLGFLAVSAALLLTACTLRGGDAAKPEDAGLTGLSAGAIEVTSLAPVPGGDAAGVPDAISAGDGTGDAMPGSTGPAPDAKAPALIDAAAPPEDPSRAPAKAAVAEPGASIRPAPRPTTVEAAKAGAAQSEATAPDAAPPDAAPPPEPPKSQPQIVCEGAGGVWGQSPDTGAFVCQRQTHEGMKACSKKSDCMGECLARSGTCAPVMPLLGCNDVLDGQGRVMTLCLD